MPRRARARTTLAAVFVLCAASMLLVGACVGAITGANTAANRTKCAANMRSIGQAIKIYASANRGRWPTVYGRDIDPANAWGEDYTPTSTATADRATVGLALADHAPFKCNASSLWLCLRDGAVTSAVFVCPATGMKPDNTTDPKDWWSFKGIENISYSYQNQLGRNTTESIDAAVVVLADRSPLRGDVAKTQRGVANKWDGNSPNHNFDGQNCLYADGHVEYNRTPLCGVKDNNIWLKSDLDVRTGLITEDTGSYADRASSISNKIDSFLVP